MTSSNHFIDGMIVRKSFQLPKIPMRHPINDMIIKKHNLKSLPLIPSITTMITPGIIGGVLGSMYGFYIMKMRTIWDKKYTELHIIKENPAYIFWGTVSGFCLGSLTGKLISYMKYKQ